MHRRGAWGLILDLELGAGAGAGAGAGVGLLARTLTGSRKRGRREGRLQRRLQLPKPPRHARHVDEPRVVAGLQQRQQPRRQRERASVVDVERRLCLQRAVATQWRSGCLGRLHRALPPPSAHTTRK